LIQFDSYFKMSRKCFICDEENCDNCGIDIAEQKRIELSFSKPAAREIINISSTENSPASKIPTVAKSKTPTTTGQGRPVVSGGLFGHKTTGLEGVAGYKTTRLDTTTGQERPVVSGQRTGGLFGHKTTGGQGRSAMDGRWNSDVYVHSNSMKKNLATSYSNDNEDNDNEAIESPTKEATDRVIKSGDKCFEEIDVVLRGTATATDTAIATETLVQSSPQNFKQTNENSNHSTSHDTRSTEAKKNKVASTDLNSLISVFSKATTLSSHPESVIPTTKVIIEYTWRSDFISDSDNTSRYLSQESQWVTDNEEDDDYEEEEDMEEEVYNDDKDYIRMPSSKPYDKSKTCPILNMKDLVGNLSKGQGEEMKVILDHQNERAYFPAKEGKQGLSRLIDLLDKDNFKIPEECPSKYHESLRMLPVLLQMISENPISCCVGYQDMIFELQPCRFPLASAGTLCEMISWLIDNEEVTIEEILDKFDLQINTLVDDASLGKTSVDDRSSTISIRGMNFFDGKGRGVDNFQQVLKHNDYATNVDEIKEFLDWAIKYLKIDGMYEKVVHQKKFTIKFFELIKWIYCNKGWLGRPLALKRAFFHFMYDSGNKDKDDKEFLDGYSFERILYACAQGDKDGNWKSNGKIGFTSNNTEVVLDTLRNSIHIGCVVDNNKAGSNNVLRILRIQKQSEDPDFLKKENKIVKDIEKNIKSVKTETEKEKAKELLLSQNEYRTRLSNIRCYCEKCGTQVKIEERYLVPDTNDASGFTIKMKSRVGNRRRPIVCSNKICGRHTSFVTYHSSKTLGALYGLGAHGFIKLPQKNASPAPVVTGLPVLQQKCDYPSCNLKTKTSYCCVNKECVKRTREPIFCTRTNTYTPYTGTFYCITHQPFHLRKMLKDEGGGDEESILYRKNTVMGYNCEHNNGAGIKIQKQITGNVVHKFKWTEKWDEKLISGYNEFKDIVVIIEVNK